MSKSNAHMPAWVLIADVSLRKEKHDHRFGTCDLLTIDEFIVAAKANQTRHLRCGYDIPWERRVKLCGCRMCTGHDERRADRRRSRHESNRELNRYKQDPGLE